MSDPESSSSKKSLLSLLSTRKEIRRGSLSDSLRPPEGTCENTGSIVDESINTGESTPDDVPRSKETSERDNNGELKKDIFDIDDAEDDLALSSLPNTYTGCAKLSPLGNAVLREAKRQLGSVNSESSVSGYSEQAITEAVDRVSRERNITIDDISRANIIVHLQREILGWGVLEPLLADPTITDIHCYDFETVVLQRGKFSETTGIRWPSHEAYCTFIDRILLRMGKSMSTQKHTVDAAFADGKRICAMHQSVCGARGPFFTLRIPRVERINMRELLELQMAPPIILRYLAALTESCEHTIMVAGETGTGKTTMLRCLGTQFRDNESIVGVEDTPELNYTHPYYRSLIARPANTEGVGEVTLQEHIRSTLRMCPTRVILGEMRTPEAAEAFLESAQAGHCGMSTIHARNARETLTRLESLLGRAQRGVSMEIIRQQIAFAVDVVVWNIREKATGKIRVAEIIEVGNFSEGQIQIRPMFRLAKGGADPVWETLSWTSYFESVLEENEISLSDQQRYVSLEEFQVTASANANGAAFSQYQVEQSG